MITCTTISAANNPPSAIHPTTAVTTSMPPRVCGRETYTRNRYNASRPAHAPNAPSPARRSTLAGIRTCAERLLRRSARRLAGGSPRKRGRSGLHRLEDLRENFGIAIQRQHDAIDDPSDVVEIYVEVRFREHADDAELHLLDADVHAGGNLHEIHRVRIKRPVRANIFHGQTDGVHGQLGDLEY